MIAFEAEVRRAAIAWWESCRPCDWSVEQHIAQPTVNTLNVEQTALALAVSALVITERKV